MWPFKRNPPPLVDNRVWNEDWRVGDTAECIIGQDKWNTLIPPWEKPAKGQRLTVSGFRDGIGYGSRAAYYFLLFSDWPVGLSTQAFRKVRTVTAEATNVAQRILDAPTPGPDIVRVPKNE